jgi:hypothetical protein
MGILRLRGHITGVEINLSLLRNLNKRLLGLFYFSLSVGFLLGIQIFGRMFAPPRKNRTGDLLAHG